MSESDFEKPVDGLMQEIQAHLTSVKVESEIDKLVNGLLEQIQGHLEKAKNNQSLLEPADINILSASLERLHNIRLTREGAHLQRKFMKKFDNFGPFKQPPNT
ncbi:MAG TPA: hypothetical protein V6D28_14760 [Leptolyngbyaceae cyanobacterium]